MAVIISAPGDLVVATSNGIDVRFAGIDLAASDIQLTSDDQGGSGVRIKFECVRTQETYRRHLLFLQAREEWAEQLRTQGKDAAGAAPTMPGVPVLSRVKALLTDNLGTEYRLTGGQIAGDGTEWEASWDYSPAPPKVAQTLKLHFTLDGETTGKECEVRLG
jgi:hypothetical protein